MLPATLDTRAESLLMLRDGDQPGEIYVLRLWPADTRLQPGDVPLWIGSAQVMQQQRAFNLIRLWRPLREARTALDAVTQATSDLDHAIAPHPDSGLPVLRLRTEGADVRPPATSEDK